MVSFGKRETCWFCVFGPFHVFLTFLLKKYLLWAGLLNRILVRLMMGWGRVRSDSVSNGVKISEKMTENGRKHVFPLRAFFSRIFFFSGLEVLTRALPFFFLRPGHLQFTPIASVHGPQPSPRVLEFFEFSTSLA